MSSFPISIIKHYARVRMFLCFLMLLIAKLSQGISEDCTTPVDCVIGEWEPWSDCTHTCGEMGTRVRTRHKFQEETCGGQCPHPISDSEPCNRVCCPQDCEMSPWGEWRFCYCTETECAEPGNRLKCLHTRERTRNASCGGYCDDVTVDSKCHQLCCLTDCVVSGWTPWGACKAQCEQPGVANRTRTVKQEMGCGGKTCPPLFEERTCLGSCCPVDCKLAEWSTWSTCKTECGTSNQTRSRYVQKVYCGGMDCDEEPVDSQSRICENYSNVDCTVSAWSSWSSCEIDNGYCGHGHKTRSRSVVTPFQCRGKVCPDLTEVGVCYGPCCRQDCEVSDWSSWGHCSTACGRGVSNRTRDVTVLPACGGSDCPSLLLQSRDCEVLNRVDCVFTPWTEWSACSTDCGKGESVRTRTLVTPAYCGGQCTSLETVEKVICESSAARRDCKMTEWNEWGQCVRNCDRGEQNRNRTIKSNPICGGKACPDTKEIRDCHEKCEQLCNQGLCSCRPGFSLKSDGFGCHEFECPRPLLEYCPPTHKFLFDCRYVYFNCFQGAKYNATCTAYCGSADWILRGEPTEIRCTEEATWTYPQLYCSKPNKPPLQVTIDITAIPENTQKDQCFAYLHTVVDNEPYERHTYTVVDDVTGRFYLRDNRVCLTVTADYEAEPRSWNATFRSTDVDGAFVENTFMFEVLNENDPPASVKVTPNIISENSPADTEVGCVSGMDDDPGQSLTFSLINSGGHTFDFFVKDNNTCIKLAKDSDPRCFVEGGNYCVLNREQKRLRYITILAMDDGSPQKSAYFDIPIYITDANDKPSGIKLDPSRILEEVEPGEALTSLLTIDEDTGQTYSYTLLEDSSGLFQISGDKLTASRSFDFETERAAFFELKIKSVDSGQPAMSVESTVLVRIQDVNERPYDLQLTSTGGTFPFEVNAPVIRENAKGVILGTVSVKDNDDKDNVTVALGDGTDNRFELKTPFCNSLPEGIVYCTVLLVTTRAFNYEEESIVDFSLVAQDSKGLTVTANLTLTVSNVNDPPSDVLFNGQSVDYLEVDEGRNNYSLAKLSAEDEDSPDIHTFSLKDSDGGRFIIKDDILKTSTTAYLDYEKQSEHAITITVEDSGTPSQLFHRLAVIKLKDVNEPPSSTSLSKNMVSEDAADGTVVGQLTSIDPDGTDQRPATFRYSLPGDSHGRFRVVGDKLVVRSSSHLCGATVCVLDYELEPVVEVTVLTMDDGSPRMSREDTFRLEVTDANDPPSDIKLSTYTVTEDVDIGTVIGDLSASDEDSAQMISFQVLDNTDVFDVADENRLVTIVSLDYERMRRYSITIAAMDDASKPATGTTTLTVTVLDVNEVPAFTNIDSISVPENSTMEEVAFNVSVWDPDHGDDLQVTLLTLSAPVRVSGVDCQTLPESMSFKGTPCIANFVLTSALNFNQHGSYSLQLLVQDKRGLTGELNLTVNVLDSNDKPEDILLDGVAVSSLHITENTANTDVTTLTAVDPDTQQTHTFILQDPSEQFDIQDNKLRVKSTANLDYETVSQYELEVKVTDSGDPPLYLEKSLTILIDDINEPPNSLRPTTLKVFENSDIDTIVGTLQATDPDTPDTEDDSFIFSLVNSADGLFRIVEDQLQVARQSDGCQRYGGNLCAINFESQPSYTLTVSVKDSGEPAQTAIFDIVVNVADVNDPPRNLQLSGNKLRADASEGTEVGTLTVEDEDSDQGHVFTMVSWDSEVFAITSEGVITKATGAGLEEGTVYSLNISASDTTVESPLQVERRFAVTVIGALSVTMTLTSEGTGVSYPVNSATVVENSDVGSLIGTVVAVYPVADSQLTFTVHSYEAVSYVSIDSDGVCNTEAGSSTCKAKLLVATNIDFETIQTIHISVTATTPESTQFVDVFDIRVTDINESPEDIEFISPTISVQEESVAEYLGHFGVTDPDRGNSHTYSLGEGSQFDLTAEGKLSTKSDAAIDYETSDTMSIRITVTDQGGLSFSKDFKVTVIDLNEKPSGLTLTVDKVAEMSEPGTIIGQLVVDDPDNIDGFQQEAVLSLVSDAGGRFLVNGHTLQVNLDGSDCVRLRGSHCLLDYETQKSHEIVVRVTDTGTPPLSNTFHMIINVADVNDAPRAVSLSNTKVPESTAEGTVVGTLTAFDEDVGQIVSFKLNSSSPFIISGSDLVVADDLDFESNQSYNISIEASDDGEPVQSLLVEFTVEVINMNESPSNMIFIHHPESASSFPDDQPIIAENSPIRTLIGQIVVLDPDGNDRLAAITSSSDVTLHNQETLHTTMGTRYTADVRTARIFDYETTTELRAEFTATDQGGRHIKKTVHIKITNQNDPPNAVLVDGVVGGEISVAEDAHDVTVANLTVKDPETDQTHTLTVVNGSSLFYLVDNQLKVTSAAQLDFETIPELSVTVRATDNGSPPLHLDQVIHVHVTDVNEPPSSILLSGNEVAEDTATGTRVGSFTVQDPDNLINTVQTFTFDLLDNADGRFQLDGSDLLVNESRFDYEMVKQYELVVKVTDSGQPALTSEMTITVLVTDSNEQPTSLQFTGLDIPENSAVRTVVGHLTARDVDTGQQLIYSIVDSSVFSVDGHSVVVSGTVDYEKTTAIQFQVKVTDDGTPPMSEMKNFTVNVQDVNEAPGLITLLETRNFTVQELLGLDEVIALVEVLDEDSSDSIDIRLRDTPGNYFTLSPRIECQLTEITIAQEAVNMTRCTASLYLRKSLDFEAVSSHEILVSVEAEDKGGLTIADSWSFTIINTNDPPSDILLDSDLSSIPENENGFVVGTLSTVDQDGDTDFIYQLVTHWETFIVNGDQLVTRTPLDYEKHQQYSVSVRTKDANAPTLTFTKEFVISVTNVNEPPSTINISHAEVEADAAVGYVVGHVKVDDPDNEGPEGAVQTHSCQATPTDFFMLTEDLDLQVSTVLPTTASTFTISITCTDSGQPALTKTQDFNITVVESITAPKAIRIVTADGKEEIRLKENTANYTIGKLIVINLLTGEPARGSYIFLLPDMETEVVSLQDNIISVSEPLDFEEQPHYTFQIQSEGADPKGRTVDLTETFTIHVEDVNEAPVSVGIYEGYEVPENSIEGAVVGHLFTSDPETYQTYTYQILAVNTGLEVTESDTQLNSIFLLEGNLLKLGPNVSQLNYESTKVVSLMIRTTDSGEIPLSVVWTLHLKVIDVNDPPTDISLSSAEVPENSKIGTVIGNLTVLDEDEDQEQECEILNLIQVPFTIVNKLQLAVGTGTIDYEAERIINVEISCGDTIPDGTNLQFTKTFTIRVTDVNEPPTSITITTTEVSENNKIGQVIGEVKVIDMDSERVQVEIETGNGFQIQGDSTLIATVVLDYETSAYHDIVVIATDTGGESTNESFTIKVTDVNEAPTLVVLGVSEVQESAQPGDVISELSTVDPDRGNSFVYTLTVQQDKEGHFAIDGRNLVVGPKGLDYETVSIHRLNIISTDDGTPAQSVQTEVIIEVTDVNEPPLEIITEFIDSIPEAMVSPTPVSSLQVDDPDQNQTHSCQVLDATNPFSVVSQADRQMLLVLTGTLNYETTSSIAVDIMCSDGEFDVQKSLSVSVSDVNEPPTAIKLSGSNTVVASAEGGYVIGELTVTDEDQGQTHTFTVTGVNSDIIQVRDGNNLTMVGAIPRTQFEKVDPSLRLTVTVADNGEPVLTFKQNFTLPITNMEVVAKELPVITIDNQEVEEGANIGTVIGQIHGQNVSFGATVVFSIVSDTRGIFRIENNSFLVLSKDLSYVDESSVQVTLEVEDTETFESAMKTISVFIKRALTCSEDLGVCSENGKCVSDNATSHHCQCNADFKGDGKTCNIIDDCMLATINNAGTGDACKNGGVCKDDINSFVCICPDGFTGSLCEIEEKKVSSCSPNPCQHEGVCIPQDDADPPTVNCSCSAGWTGRRCGLSVDDCVNAVCYSGGTCVDKHLAYTCNCEPGRKGLKCEFLDSICEQKNCNSTHTCVGLIRKQSSICVSTNKYLVVLSVNKQKYADVSSLQARLIDFISNYGRLTKRNGNFVRRKRQSNTSDPTANVYVVSASETGDAIDYSVIVLDEEEEPFSREDVLRILSATCNDIKAGGQTETVFCPAILVSVTQPQIASEEETSSVGIIVGVLFGILVLVALVVLVVMVAKKKKINTVRPEIMSEKTASRKSSTGSAISAVYARRPLPAIPSKRVSPEPYDSSMTSLSSIHGPHFDQEPILNST